MGIKSYFWNNRFEYREERKTLTDTGADLGLSCQIEMASHDAPTDQTMSRRRAMKTAPRMLSTKNTPKPSQA